MILKGDRMIWVTTLEGLEEMRVRRVGWESARRVHRWRDEAVSMMPRVGYEPWYALLVRFTRSAISRSVGAVEIQWLEALRTMTIKSEM